MSKEDLIKIQVADDKFIAISRPGSTEKLNSRMFFGMAPADLVKLFYELVDKYDLNINEDFSNRFLEERTVFGKKQKIDGGALGLAIRFAINIQALIVNGQSNVEYLIKEFKKSGDIYDLRHACSLAYLCSIYKSQKHTIDFPDKSTEKTPDLIINGITADLKVIQANDLGRIFLENKTNTITTKLAEDLCYDVGTSIRNRVCGGIKQANLIFIDLNAKSLPKMWLDIQSSGSILPTPQKYRLIYFSSAPISDEARFKMFHGTYIDFDPILWDFIKQCTTTWVYTQH
ncbi:hypothetical protein ACFLVP_01550 [Chloroflexota bacterium]